MRLGDGTNALTASPVPARSAERQHGVIDQISRARSVWRACQRAQVLAPAQVLHETGCQLGALIDGLIPGLLQMLAAMGITTLAGAAAGGLIGAVFGGVGAAPGAVIGGQLGMDAGLALLTWLGVGFLLVSIGSGIAELLGLVTTGARVAWDAPLRSDAERSAGIERAAHLFAQACGVLVRLILQGIVATLLKNLALNASRGVVQTASGVRSLGAEAAANEAVAQLVSQLRASRFGDGFAAWVEANWRSLAENPKLKPRPKMMGPVPEPVGPKAMTPSQMFPRAEPVEAPKAVPKAAPEQAPSETRAVIGRVKDLQELGPGEKSLLDRLPNLGDPKANWQQNSGVLRAEMQRGLPIRDASPLDTGGKFLNAERNLLSDHGWTFDRVTNYWMPPQH